MLEGCPIALSLGTSFDGAQWGHPPRLAAAMAMSPLEMLSMSDGRADRRRDCFRTAGGQIFVDEYVNDFEQFNKPYRCGPWTGRVVPVSPVIGVVFMTVTVTVCCVVCVVPGVSRAALGPVCLGIVGRV